jgi:NitT/TauT family transport system ATP-binding protein
MADNAKVSLRNVWMTYLTQHEEIHALQDLNLDVAEKEFISIVGPSGCGKSTVLSLVAGLLKVSRGTVSVNGQPVTGPTTAIGYMLQQDYLYKWRTILQNATLGLEVRGQKTKEAVQRIEERLVDMGLGDFMNRYPSQLSGGMRQRAALVRTLALEPDVLLLDEPFSALDYQTRLCLEDELAGILRSLGRTVILVTHDISEAISMSDRVVVMSKRPGTIINEYRMHFAGNPNSPFAVREASEFNQYFEDIWKELQENGGERKAG